MTTRPPEPPPNRCASQPVDRHWRWRKLTRPSRLMGAFDWPRPALNYRGISHRPTSFGQSAQDMRVKGCLTREIEEDLIAGKMTAWHSNEDMPVDKPPGCC